MERHYCTLFDRNYLGKAVALFRSLEAHEKRPYRIHAVCLDELSRVLLEGLHMPNVEAVPLHSIEAGDAALLASRHDRSVVEYYWTLTPTVILRLLDRNPGIGSLTYLDADLYFYSSPDPIFDEFEGASVLIHGHRFPASLAWLEKQAGHYNVGLVGFRDDARAREVLEWWRARCLEWCKADYADGKMGDQMYLNDWPTRFRGVRELMHPGAGLAPWNHQQFRIAGDGAVPTVDGEPVVFYHFHALAFANPAVMIPVKHTHYPLSEAILEAVYAPYADAMIRSHRTLQVRLPGFSAGFLEENLLQVGHTFMIRAGIQVPGGLPHRVKAYPGGWTCYLSQQVSVTAPEPRLHPATPRGPRPVDPSPAPARPDAASWSAAPAAAPSDAEVEALRARERLQPADHTVCGELGRALHAQGRIEEGLEYLVKALRMAPMDRERVLDCLRLMTDDAFFEPIKRVAMGYVDGHPDDQEMVRTLAAREELFMDNLLARSLRSDAGYEPRDYLVSALVSTYKSEAFMEECLSDLETQSIADQVEIIVVDADSPQDERGVVARFQARHRNIRYIRTPERIGIYPAWNLAIRASRGRLLTPFSTNDRLNPRAYEILANALAARPDVALVYGDTWLTNEPHQEYGKHVPTSDYDGAFRWPPYSYESLLMTCLVGPHPMWRREVHAGVGYFDGRYKAIGDQDFWIRLGGRHELLHIPEFTGLAWITKESLSGQESSRGEIFEIQHKHMRSHIIKLRREIEQLKRGVPTDARAR